MRYEVRNVIDNLRALRSEPFSFEEAEAISKELYQLDWTQKRAERIAETAKLDLETAWDLAKAEALIVDNGFQVDLARILGDSIDSEKNRLIQGIKKDYGGGGYAGKKRS